MKKSISIILGILLFQLSFGQKLEKYEEALPKILNSPSSGVAASMRKYLIDDPENSSIYFQLGVVYYERYKSSDILTDYQYKYGNATRTLQNMTQAKVLVTEKDVKKNQENFPNFGRYDSRGRLTVTWDTIQSTINNSLADVKVFVAGAPPVYESFTQSFIHYDKAHKLYTSLIGKYQTLNELFLLYDEEMDNTFEEIKSEYSKALEAFASYKAATDTFPIGYDQQLAIEDLEVYRLDGLSSEINFLVPEIHIWNYAKWVDETKAYIGENINSLRSDLNTEELRVNKVLSSAQSDFIKEQFEPLNVSKEVLFTLRKFDLQSVIEPLFLYKEAMHDVIHKQLQSDELENAEEVDPSRLFYLYGELVNKIQKTDSLLLSVRTRNTSQTHQKYPTFLQTHYGGRDGINQFVRNESDGLRKTSDRYVDKIINGIYGQLADSVENESTTYLKETLPLVISNSPSNEELTTDAVTTFKLKNFDGSMFIGGIKKNSDDMVVSYTSGITASGEVGWYNEYALKLDSGQVDANTRLATMIAVPGGCAIVLNVSQADFPEIQNRLIILDESGEEQINQSLEITFYPQSITYNDRNNSMLLGFSGKDYSSDAYESGQLILAKYNMLGERQWYQIIEGKIEMVDAVTTLDGFVIAGNYSQYRAPGGPMRRAGSNASDIGIFVINLGNDGKIIKMFNIDADIPSFATGLYKVSEDCINVLGSKESYAPDVKPINTNRPSFFMLNRNLSELARR